MRFLIRHKAKVLPLGGERGMRGAVSRLPAKLLRLAAVLLQCMAALTARAFYKRKSEN